jgi:predicted amidohydrolase YtcJ
MPGFIEGHGHFEGLGQAKMMLDLRQAEVWDDIIRQVERAAADAEPGQWIIGRGWHQAKWKRPPQPQVDGYPTHDALSRVSPNNPVLLTHASGHMNFANQEAMRLAGVDERTQAPAGGEILRDAQGAPIGVFRETAQGLIDAARTQSESRLNPASRRTQFLKAVELAGRECLSKGVTSFQDAGSSVATADLYRDLAEQGKLPVRLWVMLRDSNSKLAAELPSHRWLDLGGNFLTVRAIKRSLDGALGPHGAWLLQPYEDLPGSSGLNTAALTSVEESARLARQYDFQLCVHAIGDRANRETLDLFQRTWEGPLPAARWRIEHAQHLDPSDIPRFAELGVIASMQGVHCTSDAIFVPQRLGMRRAQEGAYVWRSLWDLGVVVSNGTDAPVEDVDPLASVYATVTRKLSDGSAFFPRQCLTREEALRSYTYNAAYAAFEEDAKGSLEVGKLADVVVLSENLLTCPDEAVRQAKVEITILGGRIVFQR